MTMYNRGLDLSLQNSFLSVPEGAWGKWQPSLSFKNGSVTSPTEGKRGEWREEVVGTLFGGHVGPLLRSISQAAAIPLPVLWENIAVRIYSLYEKRLGEGCGSEEAACISDDYYYLVHEARPDLFGEKDNPLAVFYGKPSGGAFPEPAVRMRKTCCLYYKIAPDQSCCDACPIG
ncbi:(2Fe-2S)-binding protein [Paenibacillus doosanensis]|uniref:(2Fe-2S)-binding protein n=1 Tax=Paenibacillus doosanensis TaxID=1229154 RepID=UPI00217F839D|nr:(2Fe-2S)-binding protein [Paenibacillus doosanensis]MCS7460982.1 (2Fe-2S)-binding protein [Paenibacillus doosanensis]